MSTVWVVEKATMKPIKSHKGFSDPEAALTISARTLRGLGANRVSVRNLPDWGVRAMLVHDPSGGIPIALVVEGVFLSDGLLPLPSTEEVTSPSAKDVTGSDPDTDLDYH